MTFTDTQFLSAKEKEKIFKNMKSFLKNNCSLSTFTKALYQHFHLHCGFIAHYNLNGFHDTYFTSPEGIHQWAKQMLANQNWGAYIDYKDVDDVLKGMIQEYMAKNSQALVNTARTRDLAQAQALMEKWA